MADEFITELDVVTTMADADLMVVETNPGGTPETNGITWLSIKNLINTYVSGLFTSQANSTLYNYLINGGLDFAQRQTPGTLTTIATDTYGPDRFRISRENADVQYQRNDATGETGLTSKYYGTLKKITNAGKMHSVQIIEGINSVPLRGKTVIFQIKLKASSSKTIRLGILELQNAGVIDTIPATFVSAWGANGVDPTLGANLAIITGAQSKSVTTSWQSFSVSVTIPSNSKNVVCAFWTDSQFAANDTLSFAEVALTVGSSVQAWKPRLYTQELHLCQRFYCKTFDIDTAPVNNSATNQVIRITAVVAGAATHRFPPWTFPAPMFKVPTVTFYNPSAGTAGQARDTTAGADCTGTSAAALSQVAVLINCTGAAGTAVNNSILVGISAEAEL